jgi:hypothetical protein
LCFAHKTLSSLKGAYYPPIARGQQWSKSIPGGPDGKHGPTVTVTLGDRLAPIKACLGDRVIICNISPSGRTYALASNDLPRFRSGLITPVKGHESPSLSTSYKFWVVNVVPGVFSYYDLRSRENNTFTIMPSAAHNASFFDRRP